MSWAATTTGPLDIAPCYDPSCYDRRLGQIVTAGSRDTTAWTAMENFRLLRTLRCTRRTRPCSSREPRARRLESALRIPIAGTLQPAPPCTTRTTPSRQAACNGGATRAWSNEGVASTDNAADAAAEPEAGYAPATSASTNRTAPLRAAPNATPRTEIIYRWRTRHPSQTHPPTAAPATRTAPTAAPAAHTPTTPTTPTTTTTTTR